MAQGDDVLLAASEAERLGIAYRDGKSLSIGGTPLWLVILNSVTVADRTRIGVQAGVVPSVPAYFAALRANPAEALARSREIQVEINGQQVPGYNLGSAGVLLSFDVAERAGVKYREGKRQDLGFVSAWVLEMPVRVGTQEGRAMVTVAEPEAYFKALMAGAARASSEPAPTMSAPGDVKLRAPDHDDPQETMAALKSRIDTRSEEFRANAAAMQAQVDDLRAKAAQIAGGSDARSRERHVARGKLLPRERVDGLLDPGTPFLEIGAARRLRHVRRRGAGGGHDRRHRPRPRPAK